MALTCYLCQTDNPHISFNVMQQRPATLEAADSDMLEMVRYLGPKLGVSSIEELSKTVVTTPPDETAAMIKTFGPHR